MFATPGTRRPTNNSVLKTTTWGARLAVLSLIALLAAGLSFADGKKHKLSKDLDALKGGHNGATVDVIMQFNQTPTVAHHQKVQSKGGVLKTNLDFIKGAHYSVPVESLDDLADDPDVAYVSPDREVRGSLDYVTSAVGANVVVGGGTDDFYGHGTHVAGIAGSTGKGSTCSNCTRTFKGVAPNVNLINLRVLSQTGTGTDSKVISAIQEAIALKDRLIRYARLSRPHGMRALWSSQLRGIMAGTTRQALTDTGPSQRPATILMSLPLER